MAVPKKKIQNPIILLYFKVFCGVFFGLSIAAILNRFVNFFFLCVFAGTLASGVFAFFLDQRMRKTHLHSERDSLLIKVISVLLVSVTTILTFAILAVLPLNVDRSFSVWALNEMERYGKPQSREELVLESSKFFSPNSGEISRRIDEQIRLKNIEVVGEKLRLSERGRLQVKMHRLLRKIFALEINYTR
jgi:hypothetical protein